MIDIQAETRWLMPRETPHPQFQVWREISVQHQPFYSQEWSISNFSCSLTRNITAYSMEKWRTWLFIAYSDERWFYQFSLHHLYFSLWEVGRMSFWSLGVEGLNKRRYVLCHRQASAKTSFCGKNCRYPNTPNIRTEGTTRKGALTPRTPSHPTSSSLARENRSSHRVHSKRIVFGVRVSG